MVKIKIKYKLGITMLLVSLMIAGISAAGAFPGETRACNGAGCHASPTTINITTDVTSTLTVNPGQSFTVNITWSGGNPGGTTEINWPTDFTNLVPIIIRDNTLFNPLPRIPASVLNTPNGTTNSTLTAPTTPGNHIVRVHASRGSNATIPRETDFTDINITVKAPAPTTITVSPSTATLDVNGTQVFNATALDQNNTPVAGVNISWTVSNSTIGNVTPLFAVTGPDGIASTTFTALSIGNTALNATNGTASGSANVIVGVPIEQNLTTINVSPSTATLDVNGTQVFTATALDQNNTPVAGVNISWTVSNSTVGNVTPLFAETGPDGIASTTFTALAIGNTTVNATNGTVSGGADVIVTTVPPAAGSISGMKFQDLNNNSIKDSGEPGLADWTIVLTMPGGSTETTTTDVNGNYSFSNLTTGNYTVAEVLQPNWTQTFPTNGTYNVTITDEEALTDLDFGNNLPVTPPTNVTVAVRTIEKESLRLGESTNVTVVISSNKIQALSLHEIIPAGWNLTVVTNDGADAFKSSTNEWIWFNVTPGINKTVIYRLTAPEDASIGTYHINGTISNSSGVIAVVQGDDTITLDIIAFYRRLGSDPNKVETMPDVLTAIEDWRNNIAPAGFERAITTQELLALIDEWLANG